MSRSLLLASVVCVTLSACGRTAAIPGRETADDGQATGLAANPAQAAQFGDFVIAQPVRHGNLTIFAVLSKSPRSEDRFITLDEGLKAGTVEIREMGASPPEGADDDQEFAGNDVNHLLVINRSDRPLYLMPGEVIVGGSQDRSIAEETVVDATGKPVSIEVYCVEAGRWGARDEDAAAAVLGEVAKDSADVEGLAAEANQGKFIAQAGNLNKHGRLAVQEGAGQQKVWEEVAKANTASGVMSSSGAFTANYVDKVMLKRLEPYLAAFDRSVSKQERVVGVIVAINGKLETVDVFESTPLFRKLWPQLLKSFALDALQVSEGEESKTANTLDQAASFFASIVGVQGDESKKTDGGLVVSHHETNDTVSFSASAGGTAMGGMMGGLGMGGMGGSVHASGFSK